MAEVVCIDGTRLGVHPVPVLDRDGAPYELTLRLTRDGDPFGAVGERCGYFLAATAARLRAVRAADAEQAVEWPDVDDRFPESSLEGGLRAWAQDAGVDVDPTLEVLNRYLPRDRDLFAFRHRDPDDLSSTGELRCALHTVKSWIDADEHGRGRWRLHRRAVLDAWGEAGVGVRAVLTSGELADWLDAVLDAAAASGCHYDVDDTGGLLRRPAG